MILHEGAVLAEVPKEGFGFRRTVLLIKTHCTIVKS